MMADFTMNPWLEIPLADYEGHMTSPEVAQATLLADVFEGALRRRAPTSVAVLGCAGGNGFDRIDPQVTKRVVGIDINPAYVATARERFQGRLPGLELIVADLQHDDVSIAPVDHVFVALLFEYVDADAVLTSVGRLLTPDGFVVTVLQLPKSDGPTVTPSPFVSLQPLTSCLRLVSQESLRERAAAHGLTQVESVQLNSHGGKSFQVQTFVAVSSERSKSATYTPGHSKNATEFMARRTIESHGEFFLPYLTPGVLVLDCGCGPGSITLSIANRIRNGRVVGIDFGESQIQRANETAKERGIDNAIFQQADCYSLPFEDASFDRVFSNALMEHLTDPVRAMRELLRVLKPGGVVGVSSPDWAGFVLAPSSDALTAAVAAYSALQTRNGGDVLVGRKLGSHLVAAGFENCRMSARYEVYPSLPLIGEFLALQLERAGDSASAATFRRWSQESGGLFAQCWVSCVAQAPLNQAFAQ